MSLSEKGYYQGEGETFENYECPVHQKDIAVLNVNGPNSRTPKYMKKKWSGLK